MADVLLIARRMGSVEPIPVSCADVRCWRTSCVRFGHQSVLSLSLTASPIDVAWSRTDLVRGNAAALLAVVVPLNVVGSVFTHPTDVEVIYSYLREKVLNENFSPVAIRDADLNKSEPWELPSMAKMEGKEHYFYSRKDKKYSTGSRTNRSTFYGYWKATGKDKGIYNGDGHLVGMKKTLLFYNGRAPRGHKTNWVMHEFRLEGRSLHGLPILGRDSWVVCKVTHKDGSSTEPKHGAAMIGANITSAEDNYNITNGNNNNQLGVHTGIFGTLNLPILMDSSITITATGTAAAAFSVINNQVQTQYMNTPPPMYIPTPTIGASRCFMDHSNQSPQMNGATPLLHGGGGREHAPIIATSPAVSNLEETTDEGSENYQDPAGFDEINRLLFDNNI